MCDVKKIVISQLADKNQRRTDMNGGSVKIQRRQIVLYDSW